MTWKPGVRDNRLLGSLIAFSMSFDRENLLERGMGRAHLNELLRRLATLLLRQSADLAYGGAWDKGSDNLTRALVRIVSDEQADSQSGETSEKFKVGRLYNHLAWPNYLDVDAATEAQWIHCCTVVRITQEMAGIAAADRVPDDLPLEKSPRAAFNKAVCLTAMRRMMMEPITVKIDGAGTETVPSVNACIMLGGKLRDYSGFTPGVFQEALFTLRHERPFFLLGGFGGASEVLMRAILEPGYLEEAAELKLPRLYAGCRNLGELEKGAETQPRPKDYLPPDEMMRELLDLLRKARSDPKRALDTGLNDADTRQLLTTNDVSEVVRLINKADKSKLKRAP